MLQQPEGVSRTWFQRKGIWLAQLVATVLVLAGFNWRLMVPANQSFAVSFCLMVVGVIVSVTSTVGYVLSFRR